MRRASASGTSPRSIATSPKPPLCKSRSVTCKACSSRRSDLGRRASDFGPRASYFGDGGSEVRSPPGRSPCLTAANPQQSFQLNSGGRRRHSIERVGDVHQGADFLAPGGRRQCRQQNAGASGRGRAHRFRSSIPAAARRQGHRSREFRWRPFPAQAAPQAAMPQSRPPAWARPPGVVKPAPAPSLQQKQRRRPRGRRKPGMTFRDLYISGNAEAAGRGCESQFRFLFANRYLAPGGKDCQEKGAVGGEEILIPGRIRSMGQTRNQIIQGDVCIKESHVFCRPSRVFRGRPGRLHPAALL